MYIGCIDMEELLVFLMAIGIFAVVAFIIVLLSTMYKIFRIRTK